MPPTPSRITLPCCTLLLLGGCGGPATTSGGPDVPTNGDASVATSDASGARAPQFELPTLAGGSVSLADLLGKKVVLIDFWSTTCDPCLQEMPELVRIYQERKGRGLEVLAISTDGPETASQVSSVARSKGMVFPVLLDQDTEVMDLYNPKGEMPFTAVIDRRGTIVLKRAGYQAGDAASMKTLVDAIDKALAAQ